MTKANEQTEVILKHNAKAVKVRALEAFAYTPDAHNANLGTERGQQMHENSIREVGLGRSVLADKNRKMIAGNKTLERAIELGLVNVVEVETDGNTLVVVRRTDLDLDDPDGKARLAAYYDNRVSELSLEWDGTELLNSQAAGLPLERLFTDSELAALLPPPDVDPGAGELGGNTPKDTLLKKWGVAPGDLWIIPSLTVPNGEHRIYCGDCLISSDVDCLMLNESPTAVLADPLYGIEHNTDYTRFGGMKALAPSKRNKFDAIANDDKPFDPTPFLSYKQVILWGMNSYCNKLPPGALLVWDKRHEGQDKLLSDGEVAWLNRGHGTYIFNHTWNGFLRDSERGRTLHPTQKPVELMRWCLSYFEPGCMVYDPFSGSGPVMAACELTGRVCRAMELEPGYIAEALERLEQMGLKPGRA